MARSTSASQKPTFLPAGMKRFLIKRAAETGGLALLLATGFAALALVAYDPGDPNLNHATGAPVRNLRGLPGAYLPGGRVSMPSRGHSPCSRGPVPRPIS